MSEKAPARPAWYKNTYFWIAVALFLLSMLAFIRGDDVIRDPGQKREGGLAVWYLVAAVAMYVNGWLSHSQTVRAYREAVGDNVADEGSKAAKSRGTAEPKVADTPGESTSPAS